MTAETEKYVEGLKMAVVESHARRCRGTVIFTPEGQGKDFAIWQSCDRPGCPDTPVLPGRRFKIGL